MGVRYQLHAAWFVSCRLHPNLHQSLMRNVGIAAFYCHTTEGGGSTYTRVLHFWTFFSVSKSWGRLICGSPYMWEYTVTAFIQAFSKQKQPWDEFIQESDSISCKLQFLCVKIYMFPCQLYDEYEYSCDHSIQLL